MARIRSIKPEFFRHEKLFEAECETRLPLRLAFAGLWTAADREGRFKWSPRQLKLDCLPYDDVDFSRVLDALHSRGFIVRYEVDGEIYGWIPTWSRHQIINNRERASDLPEPNENNTVTRDARVDDAPSTPLKRAQGEGKGKERKGKERKGMDSRLVADATQPSANPDFEDFWKSYPRRDGPNPRKPAEEKFNALVKTAVPAAVMIAGAKKYAADAARRGEIGTRYIKQAITWLNQQCWADHAAIAFNSDDGMIRVVDQLQLEAWDNYGKDKNGKPYPRDKGGGWRFPSKWPPGHEEKMIADVEKLAGLAPKLQQVA